MEAANVEFAVADDARFLAHALVMSERGLGRIGLWDVLFHDDDKRLDILSSWIVNDDEGPFHFTRYLVVRRGGLPVACCAGYCSGQSSMWKSRRNIQAAAKRDGGFTDEDFDEAWGRLGFLSECFPNTDYSLCYHIESVYVEPAHRGQGLASALVRAHTDRGRSTPKRKRAMITVAIGHSGAERIYTRLGYGCVGEQTNDECQAIMGFPGFRVLTFDYSRGDVIHSTQPQDSNTSPD